MAFFLIGLQGCEIYEVIDNSVPFIEPPRRCHLSSCPKDSSAGQAPVPGTPAPLAVVPPGTEDNGAANERRKTSKAEDLAAHAPAPAPPKVIDLNQAAMDKLGALKSASLRAPLRCRRLMSSHCMGELWGLASPSVCPILLHIWRRLYDPLLVYRSTIRWYLLSPPLTKHVLSTFPQMGETAVAFNDGEIWVLETAMFLPPPLPKGEVPANADRFTGEHVPDSVAEKKRILDPAGKRRIQEIKYSFDGSVLAACSHDKKIYLYSPKDAYKQLIMIKGLRSVVSNIDFGVFLYNTPGETMTFDTATEKITIISSSADGTNGVF